MKSWSRECCPSLPQPPRHSIAASVIPAQAGTQGGDVDSLVMTTQRSSKRPMASVIPLISCGLPVVRVVLIRIVVRANPIEAD